MQNCRRVVSTSNEHFPLPPEGLQPFYFLNHRRQETRVVSCAICPSKWSSCLASSTGKQQLQFLIQCQWKQIMALTNTYLHGKKIELFQRQSLIRFWGTLPRPGRAPLFCVTSSCPDKCEIPLIQFPISSHLP